MIENDLLIKIEKKLDKLMAYVMPDKKDNSKFLQEIAKLVVKCKPPRKQPKKKEETPLKRRMISIEGG